MLARVTSARGKRIAILAAAVTLMALVAAGVLTAPRLPENWYVSSLASKKLGERVEAVRWLLEHGRSPSRERAKQVGECIQREERVAFWREYEVLLEFDFPPE